MDTNKEEVYEVDADPDRIDEEMTRSQADSITKQGYLYKGPDTASDRMFAHIGSKSFKRRYCYLRQEVDGTYILELHKDEKQCEAKATIVMDFCTEVVQVSNQFDGITRRFQIVHFEITLTFSLSIPKESKTWTILFRTSNDRWP